MESAGEASGLAAIVQAHRSQLLAEPRAARRALEAAGERHRLKVFEVRAASRTENMAVAEVNKCGERLAQAEQARQESEQALKLAARQRLLRRFVEIFPEGRERGRRFPGMEIHPRRHRSLPFGRCSGNLGTVAS